MVHTKCNPIAIVREAKAYLDAHPDASVLLKSLLELTGEVPERVMEAMTLICLAQVRDVPGPDTIEHPSDRGEGLECMCLECLLEVWKTTRVQKERK